MTEVKYDIGGGKEIIAEYDESGFMEITRECFEALIEKQIPKEHHHTRIDHIVYDVRMSVCPSCLAVIPSNKAEYPNYCIRCGQHIDWSDEE